MKKRLDWLLPLIIIAVSFVAELILGNFVYFAFVAGKAQVTDYRPEQQNHTASGDKTQILFGGFDFFVVGTRNNASHCGRRKVRRMYRSYLPDSG